MDIVRYTLRLPQKMHEALRREAQTNSRSLHGQILHILKQWLIENVGTFQSE